MRSPPLLAATPASASVIPVTESFHSHPCMIIASASLARCGQDLGSGFQICGATI